MNGFLRRLVLRHGAVLTGLVLLSPACAPRQYEDPVAAMSDDELSSTATIDAMHQASQYAPDDPQRIQALKSIMSSPGHSLGERREAFQLLYEHDPEVARTALLYRLPSLPAWDFVEYACARIVEEGWTEFTPALVRSLARPMPTYELDYRPERRALEDLHPERDVRDVVFDVVAAPTEDPVFRRWRFSAWEALNALGDAEPWRDRLVALETDDPFLLDLQAGARDLGVLPRTSEELKWLQTLRQPQYDQWWSQSKQVVQTLPEGNREGLSLRHLPLLVQVSAYFPGWLDYDSGELRSMLEQILEPRKHIDMPRHSSSYRPQDFQTASEKMVWADFLALYLADHIARDPSIRDELFEQAASDANDPTTEYGGVITLEAEGLVSELFVPRRRANDLKFYASREMMVRSYTAPFHYHFHVQERRNHDFAGPGLGDLEYADSLGIQGLVFTSVGRGALNVDFYGPDDLIVDLGVIRDD